MKLTRNLSLRNLALLTLKLTRGKMVFNSRRLMLQKRGTPAPSASRGFTSRTLTFKPNSKLTHPDRVFRKPNILLAEFEQNLFKHKHWPSASQDGESLAGKQGIGDPSHGGSKQGFNRTLQREKIITEPTAHLK